MAANRKLTDVGVLQEPADPSLSFQLLVVWRKRERSLEFKPKQAKRVHVQEKPAQLSTDGRAW